MKKVVTQLGEMFKLVELHVPPNIPKFAKGFPFEFKMGRKMVQELGSFGEGFQNPTTQTSTPKSMEQVVIEVM
jgi:hypothetical protein